MKRWIVNKKIIPLAVIALILTLTALILLPSVYTSAEAVDNCAYPPSYFVADTGDPIEYQEDSQCSAYAAAYVLRYLGKDANGTELYPQIKRVFGFVPPASVAKLLKDHGCDAKAYHGDIDALKQRVAEGTPVIVFINIPHDTHYAVVTGYDENNVYLADSLPENANADEKTYNRKVGISEFEQLWKTSTLIPNNTYIAVNTK